MLALERVDRSLNDLDGGPRVIANRGREGAPEIVNREGVFC
ncbi:MAG TPA: hypothetical protein VGM56_07300 [Byssovorax sp.]|jgi:hypothetical protein